MLWERPDPFGLKSSVLLDSGLTGMGDLHSLLAFPSESSLLGSRVLTCPVFLLSFCKLKVKDVSLSCEVVWDCLTPCTEEPAHV